MSSERSTWDIINEAFVKWMSTWMCEWIIRFIRFIYYQIYILFSRLRSLGSERLSDVTSSHSMVSQMVLLMVKNLPANAGDTRDTGLIPGVRKIPWSRKWQPASVFLPGKSHGQRSLAGYSSWGHKESDTTERLCKHTQHSMAEWSKDQVA